MNIGGRNGWEGGEKSERMEGGDKVGGKGRKKKRRIREK